MLGHVNEKNFVGLATDGDYITCGSENNGLYIYYKVNKNKNAIDTKEEGKKIKLLGKNRSKMYY